MADRPPYPSSNGHTPGRGSPPGTPRWVQVSGIAAVVLALLVVVLHVTGLVGMGGHH